MSEREFDHHSGPGLVYRWRADGRSSWYFGLGLFLLLLMFLCDACHFHAYSACELFVSCRNNIHCLSSQREDSDTGI